MLAAQQHWLEGSFSLAVRLLIQSHVLSVIPAERWLLQIMGHPAQQQLIVSIKGCPPLSYGWSSCAHGWYLGWKVLTWLKPMGCHWQMGADLCSANPDLQDRTLGPLRGSPWPLVVFSCSESWGIWQRFSQLSWGLCGWHNEVSVWCTRAAAIINKKNYMVINKTDC